MQNPTLTPIIKLFENGNVCVCGLKGTGKDMLFANVACRRGKEYISNTDYGGDFIPFDYASTLALNGNTFRQFIKGELHPYTHPYKDGTDIYLADVGVYFPAQECSFLDRDYKGIPLYMALSRHINNSSVHINVQNLSRAWTKIKEMSDTFIRCLSCRVLGNIVIQKVIVYERLESCDLRVPPCPYKVPLFGKRDIKEMYRMKLLDYEVAHGAIKPLLLIYKNLSNYDTRIFKKMLQEGSTNVNC